MSTSLTFPVGRVVRAADLLRDDSPRIAVVTLGVPKIDVALPWGGLPSGLHEIAASDATGIGFATFLAARRPGPILWCRSRRAALEAGEPYGPGIAGLGLAPDRLILIEASKPADLLWAMEEGARARGLAAVLGEGVKADLTASRRLQLAAEAGEGLVLLLSDGTGPASAQSALTRWHVASCPSVPEAGGPGRPCWKLALRRCRGGGKLQEWLVEWDDAAFSLSLASALPDRPLAAAASA